LAGNGIPAISIRDPYQGWSVAKIRLQPEGPLGGTSRVRSLDAVVFRGNIHAVASVEGEGVVYFSGRSWGNLIRKKTLFADPVFRFHTAIAASRDPNGKVVAAYVPMGPYATGVAVEVIAP
jgi:hypothetical protein